MSKIDPNSLPDSEAPESPLSQPWSDADIDDEEFWGADASPPPGTYGGPSIRSAIPDPSLQRRTLREIERRFRAIQSPAFPLEFRRRLPGAVLLEGYRSFALRSRSLKVDDFGRDTAYYKSVQSSLDFLYHRWLHVDLQGLENLPINQPAILVCNHISAFGYDAMMLMHGVLSEHAKSPVVRPLLEDRIAQSPFLGVALQRLGCVRACQQNAERLLKDGAQIAVFPEGRHALRKRPTCPTELARFGRGGFIRLAMRTGAPILPVAIVSHGGSKGDPSLEKLPRALKMIPNWVSRLAPLPAPGRWSIVIGEPIDLSAEVTATPGHDRVAVAQNAAAVRMQILKTIESLLLP